MSDVTATVRVMSPEEIVAKAGGETPFLHWPQRSTLFAEREMRLRQLANGHAMGDFLLFMAELAHQQQLRLADFPAVPLPDGAALERAARAGLPPLAATDWPRDPAWRDTLRALLAGLQATAPPAALAVLQQLAQSSDDRLELQADCLLDGVMQGLDLAAAPFVAAALQVYWSHMLLTLHEREAPLNPAFGRIDDSLACPCCGSRPTASITRSSGDSLGQRYLHCSLCSLQWHLLRIQCAHCGSGKKISYQALDPLDPLDADDAGVRAAKAVIQAECCDDCGHYLKLVHSDRDPFVEPAADDLASLTLDLLVSETGKQRHGVNLMLLFGEPEPPDSPGAT
jgi:FdhE protein